MSAIKLLTFSYFVGAAICAFALVVIILALFGIETIGRRISLAYPIIGGFVLMMGSKYLAARQMRKGANHG